VSSADDYIKLLQSMQAEVQVREAQMRMVREQQARPITRNTTISPVNPLSEEEKRDIMDFLKGYGTFPDELAKIRSKSIKL